MQVERQPHMNEEILTLGYSDDESYRAAKQMIDEGQFGEIHAVETACLDQQDPTGKNHSWLLLVWPEEIG